MDSDTDKNTCRVCLMGAPIGIGNRGVSALGASLVRLVVGARPDAEISLLVGSRKSGPLAVQVDGVQREIDFIPYRLSPRAPLQQQLWWIMTLALIYRFVPLKGLRDAILAKNRWLRAAATCRLLGDIRGGDSFSDIYGVRNFILGSLPVLSVIWVRGSIVLFPQTYGPFKSMWARLFARSILNHAGLILTRDEAGLQMVPKLTRGRHRARFCPDVAFALEAIPVPNPVIEPPLSDNPGKIVIGVNISGLLFNGGFNRNNMFELKLDYRSFIRNLLSELLVLPGVEILLVPHTFAPPGRVESDNGACLELLKAAPSELASRLHLVAAEYDQHAIKAIIGMCDFFIGSRMHACIAALSQGIPAVGVAYSLKFAGVFGSVGAADWVVDGRSVDAASAVARILCLFHQRHDLQQGLVKQLSNTQKLLQQEFARLFDQASSELEKPSKSN